MSGKNYIIEKKAFYWFMVNIYSFRILVNFNCMFYTFNPCKVVVKSRGHSGEDYLLSLKLASSRSVKHFQPISSIPSVCFESSRFYDIEAYYSRVQCNFLKFKVGQSRSLFYFY